MAKLPSIIFAVLLLICYFHLAESRSRTKERIACKIPKQPFRKLNVQGNDSDKIEGEVVYTNAAISGEIPPPGSRRFFVSDGAYKDAYLKCVYYMTEYVEDIASAGNTPILISDPGGRFRPDDNYKRWLFNSRTTFSTSAIVRCKSATTGKNFYLSEPCPPSNINCEIKQVKLPGDWDNFGNDLIFETSWDNFEGILRQCTDKELAIYDEITATKIIGGPEAKIRIKEQNRIPNGTDYSQFFIINIWNQIRSKDSVYCEPANKTGLNLTYQFLPDPPRDIRISGNPAGYMVGKDEYKRLYNACFDKLQRYILNMSIVPQSSPKVVPLFCDSVVKQEGDPSAPCRKKIFNERTTFFATAKVKCGYTKNTSSIIKDSTGADYSMSGDWDYGGNKVVFSTTWELFKNRYTACVEACKHNPANRGGWCLSLKEMKVVAVNGTEYDIKIRENNTIVNDRFIHDAVQSRKLKEAPPPPRVEKTAPDCTFASNLTTATMNFDMSGTFSLHKIYGREHFLVSLDTYKKGYEKCVGFDSSTKTCRNGFVKRMQASYANLLVYDFKITDPGYNRVATENDNKLLYDHLCIKRMYIHCAYPQLNTSTKSLVGHTNGTWEGGNDGTKKVYVVSEEEYKTLYTRCIKEFMQRGDCEWAHPMQLLVFENQPPAPAVYDFKINNSQRSLDDIERSVVNETCPKCKVTDCYPTKKLVYLGRVSCGYPNENNSVVNITIAEGMHGEFKFAGEKKAFYVMSDEYGRIYKKCVGYMDPNRPANKNCSKGIVHPIKAYYRESGYEIKINGWQFYPQVTLDDNKNFYNQICGGRQPAGKKKVSHLATKKEKTKALPKKTAKKKEVVKKYTTKKALPRKSVAKQTKKVAPRKRKN